MEIWSVLKEKLASFHYGAIYITQEESADTWGDYRLLAGFSQTAIEEPTNLDELISQNKWLMGGFAYHYNTPIPQKASTIPFPAHFWFIPEEKFELTASQSLPLMPEFSSICPILTFTSELSDEKYLSTVQKIKRYIQAGDHYEMNLTREFIGYGEIPVFETFIKLIQTSPTPFSVLLKWKDQFILCASPERFLKKQGQLLISQPIKGTIPRRNEDLEESVKKQFYENKKFRSENVMIVDLVRNDLSKVCRPTSVRVNRLFEVQSFKYLHHLVSTISGEIEPHICPTSIFSALFPPGSMTGAPKLRAMQRITELEPSGRGIYSGALGYICDGNFDWNVVIRSIIYDAKNKCVSFHTGGAITAMSNAEEELSETNIKARAIIELLTQNKIIH